MKNQNLKVNWPKPAKAQKPMRVVIVQNPTNKWFVSYQQARDNLNTHQASVRYADAING